MKSKSGMSVGNIAYNVLKEEIMSGRLKPGERIPEQKLAQQLGLSRTPVKEALTQLAAEGVVEMIPNKFSRVAVYGEEETVKIGVTRLFFDLMAARFVLYYGSMADFNKLRKLAYNCIAAAESKDNHKRVEADAQFHSAFVECTKNKYLCELQRSLGIRVEHINASKTFSQEEYMELCRYHLELVESLFDRDIKKTDEIIINHFYMFYELDRYYPKELFCIDG